MASTGPKRQTRKRRPLATSTAGELGLIRFLHHLTARLEEIRDEPSKLRHGLRAARDYFEASEGCVPMLKPPADQPVVSFGIPPDGQWDDEVLSTFIAGGNPNVPDNVIGAAVPRRRRPWAAVVLRKPSGVFRPGDGRALARITAAVAQSIERLERQRALEVRDRLDRKVMEQLRPRDLFYQLLHGIRSLVRYDHSSALLISDDGGATLKLVAEQLACIKGKSHSIGRRFKLDNNLRELLDDSKTYGFARRGERWEAWVSDTAGAAGSGPGRGLKQKAGQADHGATAVDRHAGGDHRGHVVTTAGRAADTAVIAELLDYNRASAGQSALPLERAMICAPIATRGGVIGVLKVSATYPEHLGPAEADMVKVFQSQASVAIQYLQGTEALRRQVREAERKQAVANVARGISHDINNALGSVLPIVQQLREEATSDDVDPQTLAGDLAQIERSLQATRRILTGMLSLARGGARGVGDGNIRRALDNALDILEDGLTRAGIALELDIADDLPTVRLRQGDLAQVLLNIAGNAREAMPQGGKLAVRAVHDNGNIEVEISDTGCGIAPDQMRRIEEPFFTTKSNGNGLGLSICRSILTEARGKMHIHSAPGKGTSVRLLLPASKDDQRTSGDPHSAQESSS